MRRALLLLLAAALPGAAMVRMAVLVGNNAGLAEEQVLQFATRDAEQVKATLEQLGGVDKGEARLLLDGDAPRLLALLKDTRERIAVLRAKGEKVQLLVYYSGHGSSEALHMNGGSLPIATIREAFRDLGADLKILIADACFSGALISPKGGLLAAPMPVTYVDELKVNGSAILTSSSAGELSQESKELRGSIFTHYFLSAIRGAGDADRDGAVTLWEAYTHTLSGMRRKLASATGAAQNPEFELDLKGSENVILTKVNLGQALLSLKGVPEGRYRVLEATHAMPVAEVHVADPEGAVLALPRGAYLVYRSAANGGVSGYADLRKTTRLVLGPADLKEVSPGVLRPKGPAAFESALPPVRLSAEPRFYPSFPGGTGVSAALEGALRLRAGSWSTAAAYAYLFPGETSIGPGMALRRFGHGFSARLHRHFREGRRLGLFAGIRGETWLLNQAIDGETLGDDSARLAGGMLILGADLRLGAGISLSATLGPGSLWSYRADGGLRADPVLPFTLGLGFGR